MLGDDLRIKTLKKNHERMLRENAKFKQLMEQLDNNGTAGVASVRITKLSSEQRKRFDDFAKTWKKQQLEHLASQLSAFHFYESTEQNPFLPHVHLSVIHVSPFPATDCTTIANPFPPLQGDAAFSKNQLG